MAKVTRQWLNSTPEGIFFRFFCPGTLRWLIHCPSYAQPAFGGKVDATASNLGWGQPSLVCTPFSLACRCLPLSNIDSLALVRTHFFLIEAGRPCVSKSALDLVLTWMSRNHVIHSYAATLWVRGRVKGIQFRGCPEKNLILLG